MISWMPAKNFEFFADKYDPKGRIKAKPARALRHFISKEGLNHIHDSDWETFTLRFIAQNDQTRESLIERVYGEDIRKYYHEENYTNLKNSQPLLDSCMRYTKHQKYLDLYVKNPKRISMLVQFDSDNKVSGRALVWLLDDGRTYVDRIYSAYNDIPLFQEIARKNDWLHRKFNSYSYPTSFIKPNGANTRVYATVDLEHVPRSFPYADTFLFINTKEGFLANSGTLLRHVPRYNVRKLRHINGASYAP
jgi:hypothetical protein